MRRQYDVVTHDQLVEAGLSPATVWRAAVRGDLARLYKGVYIDPAAPVRPESRLLGACLAAGRGAQASHRGAGWLWGLTEQPFVELTRPIGSNAHLPGCVVHRTSVVPRPVLRRRIRCTNPLRTMVDLAGVIDGDDLWLAFARGISARLFTPDGVKEENERLRRPGRRGSVALDGVLAELGPVSLRSPSVLQMAFARLVVRAGLEWPESEVEVRGGEYRIDYAYRDVLLAIELNGFDAHGDPIAAAAWHRRVRALTALGWTVLVFTWDDVWNRPEEVMADTRAHLARLRG